MAVHDWQKLLREGAERLGVSLPRASLERFSRYLSLLLRFSQRLGLTSVVEPEQIAVKHFLDSLTCLPALELHQPVAGRSLVDVGSGAGFPGIPLAIVRPKLRVTLLESSAKKCRFVETVADQLELKNVSVVCSRAEAFGTQEGARESFDIAVSRALAPLPVLAEYCLPLVKVGGLFLAMKGPKGVAEIEQIEAALRTLGGRVYSTRGLSLPHGAGERVLILIEKAAPTPPKYPRRPGIPARRPL